MARKTREDAFEVSATEKVYASFYAAVNAAQMYAERELDKPSTVYVRNLGETKALARIERESSGAVTTHTGAAR